MEVSKIQLSSSEMELVQNAEIILTKNRVLSKVNALLDELQQKQLGYLDITNLGNDIFSVHPKISKGENYLGLPYLILDHPRLSTSNDFFFIRSMFWWGNFFSCTLQLAGNSKERFKSTIKNSYAQLKEHFIAVDPDPWVHHFEQNNYQSIGSMTEEEFHQACHQFDHIKIAKRYPLNEWENIPAILFNEWNFFLSVCRLIP